MSANRFKKGSGVFQCVICTRKTRDTGGDNTDLNLCEECYEIAGYENQISDQGYSEHVTHEIDRLKAECRKKGGKL